MPRSNPPTRSRWTLLPIVLPFVGLVVWAMTRISGDNGEKKNDAAEFSREALTRRIEEPGGPRHLFRELANREDLSDEQRRAALASLRSIRQERMKERIDEYFAAAEEDRPQILDQHIDELQARFQQFAGRDGGPPQPDEATRESFRRLFGSRSQQERKADSESRNPDDTARGMAYFSALRGRMEERGISLPRGRGGRWGGP